MMNETGFRRILPDQSSGSGPTIGTPRHPSIIDPILSKRVCFYKSGDPQFNGLRMVINNRTFKTFDALLDSLSKKVPLPFGVRNITTPRGVHAVYTLDELEDGKSYICSDSRKVKPINLALARKKMPPWYHARPVSSRRRTVQQARLFPGHNLHKQEPVLVRTPKRLLVFRNGDPSVKHTVVLQKRTTPTFESILGYISELFNFQVVKFYTVDGRRVDGLPGLILCSGTVVAVGREPFRHANYNAQKSPVPTLLPTKQMGHRTLRSIKRKKKSLPYTLKSRNFSPSSERYIVNRIHNAESSCDLPSHSVELESSRMLESVPETPDTCLGAGAEAVLPTDDDIEKSFRVNQDGSMTVEMRVRLTIKEEETVHWTTTLSRSSVANRLNATCLPQSEVEQEISSLKSNSLDLSSAASIDTIKKDKTQDNNDEDPPSLSTGAFSESSNEEDDIKVQMDVVSPRRAPTPGHKQIRKKQTSMESVQSVTAEGIQEGMVGSYSYSEQKENGAVMEQYCMVKQSSTRPVPKPRRLGSMDSSNINRRNISKFKSAGMTEILQIESSGDEVTETFLHMYEQQTCQDNFFANLCSQETSGIPFYRPATSETGQNSSPEFEPQLRRPSTASESISIWRAQSASLTSDLTLPLMRTGAFQPAEAQKPLPKPAKGKPQKREAGKDKRVSPKPKVINQRVRRIMSPGKRQKENAGEATKKSKKVKTFSSAGFIKKIYGTKSKSPKSMMKLKKRPIQNGDRSVATMSSSQQSDDTIMHVDKDANKPAELKESPEKSNLNVALNEVSQPRGVLTRQTSVHREKKESGDDGESMPLPAFNSSSSVAHEYVESWLEKAHHNLTANANEEGKKLEAATVEQAKNNSCEESESRNGLMVEAEFKCQTLKTDQLPELRGSVRRRIQSFENKSPSPPTEKTPVNQQMANGHATTEIYSSLAQVSTEEIKPLLNHSCSEIIPPTNVTSADIQSGSEVENKSSSIKILFQKATPSHTLSMELPLPPPPPSAEYPELSNTEHCLMDECSVASSPLYRISSVSSQSSDYHPLSIGSTSDISPVDHTVEMTTSIQTDIPSTQRDEPLPRSPSIKRAPLVSNTSLDRKMSLRKAGLDKYTLCSDATSEEHPSTNIGGDSVLPNGICSTGIQRPSEAPPKEMQQSNRIVKTSPSFGTSASPTSLTTEERMSPMSLPSSEATTPSELPSKETKTAQLLTLSSPKSPVKKLLSSPSPERKSHSKKSSSEHLHNYPPDTTLSPNTGQQRHATPNASPSPERKMYKAKLQNRLSPYSQSLDMVSPPVRHRSNGKTLSRNLSSDNASEPTSKTQRKTSSQGKRQTQQTIKSTSEVEKTQTLIPLEPDQSHEEVTDDPKTADQEKSITQKMPQPLNIAHQPNMKPVLEKICYSIKSIRQITQNKRPSCLEKSNSLPDFSSHVASTFGSSSKALLAFLSVMTLKEGISHQNMDELNANNVSCAEALKMIDSLREIASMEDSQQLKVSLSNLQQSASKQLLESWKGFQELGEKCKSRSSTPNDSEQEIMMEASSEKGCGIDEKVIDEIVDSLDIPDKLKEELASLSVDVISDSDKEEKTEKVEPEDDRTAKVQSHFPTEDALNVKAVTQDEKVDVDVSSMIKKFTYINQPKSQDTKNKDTLSWRNGMATWPLEKPTEIPKERQLYSSVSDNSPNEGKSNQEKVQMNGVVEVEKQDMEGNQLQMQSEETILGNELTYDGESGSDEEGENMSSAIKDLEQNLSWKQSVSSSESGEQPSSEAEVDCEEIRQGSRGSDKLSNPESRSEEEEEKQPSSDCYVEVNVRGKGIMSSPESQDRSLSEEEQPEVECQTASLEPNVSVDEMMCDSEDEDDDDPSSEEGQFDVECQAGSIKSKVSVNQSRCNSDVDDPFSEEEVESKELKVIIEESLSGLEEEEEEHFNELPVQREQPKPVEGRKLKVVREETEEVSSDNEEPHVEGDLSKLIENQHLYTKKDNGGLMKADSLTKRFRFNADEDSGNDHSSCDEHVELEQPKVEKELISSSNEEEFSFEEKDSSSEEEHVIMSRYIEESCAEYQETTPALAAKSKGTECINAVEKPQRHTEEIITQSVAERVILLEKQVAEAQKTTETSAIVHFSQRNAQRESDIEDSTTELPTSQQAPSSRSAPQSSLSFSYDSSGVITTEPEGRVRSIREMFLAKNGTDIQHGHGGFPSVITSERSEIRAQTSTSAGYQSQTSSELSSSEDDSSRKSIKKGFVRRTIERLYGKKDSKPDEEVSERPPSAPKEKKEHSSIFSPFHIARSKAMELSYFHSTNALDTLASAFNAQVGPEDSIPIDNDQWLLRENTLIRKSVSDPIGINKNLTNSSQSEGMCKDTEENTTYSFFSTKSELEDKKSPLSRKCTYFSLPHASDSDACQEELSTVSKASANGDSVTDIKDNPEDAKTWAERNGSLPGAAVTEFKMKDNKVHPLVELPPDGEVVAVQPGRGQGVMSRRLQEPDMLDILYDFCGQNCPIL